MFEQLRRQLDKVTQHTRARKPSYVTATEAHADRARTHGTACARREDSRVVERAIFGKIVVVTTIGNTSPSMRDASDSGSSRAAALVGRAKLSCMNTRSDTRRHHLVHAHIGVVRTDVRSWGCDNRYRIAGAHNRMLLDHAIEREVTVDRRIVDGVACLRTRSAFKSASPTARCRPARRVQRDRTQRSTSSGDFAFAGSRRSAAASQCIWLPAMRSTSA